MSTIGTQRILEITFRINSNEVECSAPEGIGIGGISRVEGTLARCADGRSTLQWRRLLNTAERQPCTRRRRRNNHASMGPPFEYGGECFYLW